jgi:hypothetical protein
MLKVLDLKCLSMRMLILVFQDKRDKLMIHPHIHIKRMGSAQDIQRGTNHHFTRLLVKKEHLLTMKVFIQPSLEINNSNSNSSIKGEQLVIQEAKAEKEEMAIEK